MKHRFLGTALNHTFLIVDITAAGLPNEVFPHEGKPQTMRSLRFQNWNHVERYLSELGASGESLKNVTALLEDNKRRGSDNQVTGTGKPRPVCRFRPASYKITGSLQRAALVVRARRY